MIWRMLGIRLALSVVTLAGVAVIVFVLLRAVPGNPIAMMIAPGATAADIAALEARYGFDRSLVDQFLIWAGDMLTGDFGTSISLRQDVVTLVAGRLPATLELAFLALIVAVVIGTAIAVLSTRLRENWTGDAIDTANGLSLAIPEFIWALAFVFLLGVIWPVLPVSGRIDPVLDPGFVTDFLLIESLLRFRFDVTADVLSHMAMPTFALALPLAAVIARVLKSALLEAMAQEYVILARLKGFGEFAVIWREALRNAVLPTLALTGVQFTFLLGGTVIVERIFAYPGLGNMAIDAVINRDLPLIQGLVLTFGVMFILINLTVDVLAVAINPRLRDAG
ncbi:MAG: ABC transporter permease [Minwuia sp.]|uniref:ABC transporter permease n=1 Tax=Minwuia sp. TaxID=2493630 RepID=UPI003A8788A9